MRYRFDGFTLDLATRQLLSGGDEIRLSPKGFDLLALLVENRSRALSKVELQEKLWPSTFVEETNLATLAVEVRRALRDSAAAPALLRTVYGFGYHFIANVSADVGATAREAARERPCVILEQRPIPLAEGVNVIGRAADVAIPIDSPGLSRHHARITVNDGEAVLEDLGSKNGTHLDGTRITGPCRLAAGSQIRLGTVVLTFRIASPTSPTETVPAELA